MSELLVDFITSLDGYASGEGWPGFWGLEGPEYLAWLGEQPEVTYLMGANTYRLMSGFAAGEVPPGQDDFRPEEEASIDELSRASKVVFSSSLEEPLTWPNCTLVRGDAVEAVRAMKENGHTDEEIMQAFTVPVDMKVFKYGSSYNDPQEVDVRMSPRDSIIYYKKFLRAAVCAIDPTNGQVKAYVPGLDFEHFMYDNVLGGGHRQVGSTIKPLLYSLALSSQDFTPCDVVDASPRDYGGWTPK